MKVVLLLMILFNKYILIISSLLTTQLADRGVCVRVNACVYVFLKVCIKEIQRVQGIF